MKQLNNVRHDYIRYANCWEDANVLINGLNIKPTDKVASIGSAGDNCFSLLTQNPSLVVAVDINEIQLHLVELKKAAFKYLTYHQFLNFLGFLDRANRLTIFDSISNHLPKEAHEYWSKNTDLIQNGLIHQGKFEKYFKLFRTKILPWVHSKKSIDKLIEPKSQNEQSLFFEKTWSNWRWNLLINIFFSERIMGKYGRDPAFFNEVKVPIGEFLKAKSKHHLSSTLCQSNPFVQYILKGDFGRKLPHYAQEKHFDLIKKNIDRIKTHKGVLEDSFAEYGTFDKFNLSNIFEYMDENTFEAVSNQIIQFSNPESRYVYWNLMVDRELRKIDPKILIDEALTDESRRKDDGFFYSGVHINYLS